MSFDTEHDEVMYRFRKGIAKVSISTNITIIARDIEVMQADHDTYLHHIGRTGQFGIITITTM
ncbi:7984_t:CDS:2 [Diversispora eburnea]|uniref:7984_t:CDS:1 n=1 Tax=Diversispora eburnea TaxID=1213867 RepID=A0A9N8ZRK6_9GLOM|nr:7984_t:CDS:2 [Diversispora eburnea]